MLAPSPTLIYYHEVNDSLLSRRRCSCQSAELSYRHGQPLCWLAVSPALEGTAEPLHCQGCLRSAFCKADPSAAASGPGRSHEGATERPGSISGLRWLGFFCKQIVSTTYRQWEKIQNLFLEALWGELQLKQGQRTPFLMFLGKEKCLFKENIFRTLVKTLPLIATSTVFNPL